MGNHSISLWWCLWGGWIDIHLFASVGAKFVWELELKLEPFNNITLKISLQNLCWPQIKSLGLYISSWVKFVSASFSPFDLQIHSSLISVTLCALGGWPRITVLSDPSFSSFYGLQSMGVNKRLVNGGRVKLRQGGRREEMPLLHFTFTFQTLVIETVFLWPKSATNVPPLLELRCPDICCLFPYSCPHP